MSFYGPLITSGEEDPHVNVLQKRTAVIDLTWRLFIAFREEMIPKNLATPVADEKIDYCISLARRIIDRTYASFEDELKKAAADSEEYAKKRQAEFMKRAPGMGTALTESELKDILGEDNPAMAMCEKFGVSPEKAYEAGLALLRERTQAPKETRENPNADIVKDVMKEEDEKGGG